MVRFRKLNLQNGRMGSWSIFRRDKLVDEPVLELTLLLALKDGATRIRYAVHDSELRIYFYLGDKCLELLPILIVGPSIFEKLSNLLGGAPKNNNTTVFIQFRKGYVIAEVDCASDCISITFRESNLSRSAASELLQTYFAKRSSQETVAPVDIERPIDTEGILKDYFDSVGEERS